MIYTRSRMVSCSLWELSNKLLKHENDSYKRFHGRNHFPVCRQTIRNAHLRVILKTQRVATWQQRRPEMKLEGKQIFTDLLVPRNQQATAT
jgi:ssDNA-binding Zn-finger/Zn-ribbon topoisomerase 1